MPTQEVCVAKTAEEIFRGVRTLDPKNKAVQKALGISPKSAELLWVALGAVPEGSTNLPGFTKTAKKLGFKQADLGRLALLKKGPNRGDYKFGKVALKRMEKLLDGGVPAEETEQPAPESNAGPKGRGGKRGKRSAAPSETRIGGSIGKIINKLQGHLAKLDRDIEAKQAERSQIHAAIASISTRREK